MKKIIFIACIFVSSVGSARKEFHMTPADRPGWEIIEVNNAADVRHRAHLLAVFNSVSENAGRATITLNNAQAAYNDGSLALMEITSSLEKYKTENALLLNAYYQKSDQLRFFQNQTSIFERYLMYGQKIVMQESDDLMVELSSYYRRLNLRDVPEEPDCPTFADKWNVCELVVGMTKDFAQENKNLNDLGLDLKNINTSVPGMLYAALIQADKIAVENMIEKVSLAVISREQSSHVQKTKILGMGEAFKILDELETKLKLALNAMDAANINLLAATEGSRVADEQRVQAKHEYDSFKVRIEKKRVRSSF